MTRKKVFMTRNYHPDATELLKEHYDVDIWQENNTPPYDILREKVENYSAIFIESYDKIDSELLSASKELEIISTRAVGTDNIDIAAATKQGVLVANTPGVLENACADFTWALMLDIARRISFSDRSVRDGKWTKLDQLPYLSTDIYGKTLGIVGLGGIGYRVAKRATGFDMRIIYHSRTRKREIETELGLEWAENLELVLKNSDYLSLHMPLTPETEHMIGESELNKMKKEAFLINTSRGRTVDQNALTKALIEKKIAGAALDVTDPEPIPKNDLLTTLPNVVITPHIASASTENFANMAKMAAQNIIAALSNTPMPSCLNPDAYQYR